jgi:thioredoxin-dependent peroxiredoxin
VWPARKAFGAAATNPTNRSTFQQEITMRMSPGRRAVDFDVTDINGARWSLRALRGRPILLSFFRDAACPFCNLRVYELTRLYASLQARYGLTMIGFFQSSAEEIRRHVGRAPRPFPLVPDPHNAVYQRYAVESSMGGSVWAIVSRMPTLLRAMFGHLLFPRTLNTTLPADFLIGPGLMVQLAHYGRDAGDHLPVAALLEALRGSEVATPLAAIATAQTSRPGA